MRLTRTKHYRNTIFISTQFIEYYVINTINTNTFPFSGSEITGLAHRLGYEREVIRIWFCNKRQALKNTVRTINGNGPTHMTKSHNNTSGY